MKTYQQIANQDIKSVKTKLLEQARAEITQDISQNNVPESEKPKLFDIGASIMKELDSRKGNNTSNPAHQSNPKENKKNQQKDLKPSIGRFSNKTTTNQNTNTQPKPVQELQIKPKDTRSNMQLGRVPQHKKKESSTTMTILLFLTMIVLVFVLLAMI